MKTKGFSIGIIILVLMVCTSCNKDEALPTPDGESSALKSTKKSKNKITICHYSADEDKWILLNVSVNAWPAHEAHGDVILIDSDGDGFYPDNECGFQPSGDCDDKDACVYPGATEIYGDGIDNDCDGQIDEPIDFIFNVCTNTSDGSYYAHLSEGAVVIDYYNCAYCECYPESVVYPDYDGDGYHVDDGDCNDAEASAYPGATEIYGDGIDNDCDELVDEIYTGEMVYIDGFWIDRYEASLYEWLSGQDPGEFPAISIPGVFPQVNITQVQAKAACQNAGKRLCTDQEWLRACQGPDGLTYPYGDTEVPDLCNVGQPDLDAILMLTGESSYCLTADGVNDMVGNVYEWTADPSGVVRGGDYLDVGYNGPGCLNRITAFNVSFSHERFGFRCCSDSEPSVISRPMSTTE